MMIHWIKIGIIKFDSDSVRGVEMIGLKEVIELMKLIRR